ncbi:MAG: outer membrane protein assembly factor BamA [Ignavibacteriales bacterium]|nr:outer membrane protein assembly factor BamA [Ignavibacteriales bacterium]
MSRSSKLVLLLSLVSLSALVAQQRPEVHKILGITVEGQTSAEPSAIIANTGLKVGDELVLPGDQARTAIERLYNLRLFDDVQIFIENRTPEGVYLLIRVRENPRLERIEVVGNDELSESDITKEVNLVKGQIVNRQDLSVIVRSIKRKYDEDGYLSAVIEPKLIPVDSTARRVALRIEIEEGVKVKVEKIRFVGNKLLSDDDLKGEMKETSERRWWKFWTSAKFDKKKYGEDKHLILGLYRKNGFRDAEILADSLLYDDSKRFLTIDLYVYEGPQYKVRNVVWEGNSVYPSEILNLRLGFQKGDIFDREKFEKNLYRSEEETDVSSLYLDNGYLTFQVEPEEIRVGEDSLDLVLHVRERNQFRIGRVLISGNQKTYEKVIRRELYTRPGDYFSRSGIIRSARQLSQLNYFNPEKIKPDYRIVDEKTVDLEYSVEEKSSDTFNMSVGYSGVFGFNGALGLTFNNFSLSEPLKGGAGQVMSFDWQFGEGNRYRTFSIGFQEPWMFDTPTLFGVNLFDTRQIFYYDLRLTGASVRVGRRFKWPDPLFRGDWTLRYQRNDVKYGGDYYTPGITTQIGVNQVISRNSTDSPIFPSHGSNFSLATEISGGPFLPGNSKFHKHIFSADWFVPIMGSSRIALATSTLVGFIFGFEKNPLIPPQEYFYMGGTGLGQFSTTPLRGYDDRAVGPTLSNGQVIGGQAILKYSAELRFALALNPIPIYTLFFAEAGNVWLENRVQDPLDLRRSAGVGVRLLINPIGLIGFDYGYGFDAPSPGGTPSGWKFHFQFGRGF